jgi:hypothetical protein
MEICPCSKTKVVKVIIARDLSYTGRERIKEAQIDKCIAPLVKELQTFGINMRSSCCGHGEIHGHIILSDRTELKIK